MPPKPLFAYFNSVTTAVINYLKKMALKKPDSNLRTWLRRRVMKSLKKLLSYFNVLCDSVIIFTLIIAPIPRNSLGEFPLNYTFTGFVIQVVFSEKPIAFFFLA